MSVRSYPYMSGHRRCGGDPGFIGSLCIVHGFFVSDAFFNSVSILRNFLLNLGFKYWLGVAWCVWCYRYAGVYFVFVIFASGCGSAVGARGISGLPLVFGWGGAAGGGGLISIFREFSAVPSYFPRFSVLRHSANGYTMCISNNRASFHLW